MTEPDVCACPHDSAEMPKALCNGAVVVIVTGSPESAI